jgi:small subunit ribosomal protein S3
MMEKKFIEGKKQEFEIKEYVKSKFGKGKVSDIKIERTPIGEKIVIYTTKPGLIIGKKGEVIGEINQILKKKFHLENPQIEVAEVTEPFFDALTMADNIALSLEKFGPLRFKIIAYRALERIMNAGALGAEIVLSGKLPSERAKSWRFAYGYLKKTGENKGIVRIAKATANTLPGTVGVKVSIIPKNVKIPDKIDLSLIKEHIIESISEAEEEVKEEIKEEKVEKKEEKKLEKKKGGRKKKEKKKDVGEKKIKKKRGRKKKGEKK